MDPHTGRVLAMVGGYSFNDANGLNRATQAQRQPGSSFKPIVYAAALDYGLTPATLVDDAPLSISAGDGSNWSPENYTREFYGPTTLRRGLELSRNAMTARVASSGETSRAAYSASSSAALSWCSSAMPAHCHDTAAMSLAKIGELAHNPFSPLRATATCAGLKM